MSNKKKGFTLVELLIVIGILAILTAAVVVVLNPAELLKQARDSQRLSDLDAMRNAIALYLTDVASPSIGTTATCYTAVSTSSVTCGGMFTTTSISSTTAQTVDGNGWVPIALSNISSGAPLSKWPVDPTNSGVYYYGYTGNSTSLTFELNANLESSKYATKESSDGGNSTSFYEVGSDPGLDL